MLYIFYLIPLILIGLEPTHVVLTNDNNVHMVQVVTITDSEFILLDANGDTLKIPLGMVKKISVILNSGKPQISFRDDAETVSLKKSSDYWDKKIPSRGFKSHGS